MNGVQEAAYHGVPVIGFPLFGDQFENLLRVQERGFGIIVNRDLFTAESLAAAVREIFQNPSFVKHALSLFTFPTEEKVPCQRQASVGCYPRHQTHTD